MKTKLTILVVLVTVLSLALVGAGLAAGPDPEAQPGPGQGVLEIRALDHEITVAYQGTGYNLHRFSSLRLAVNPGSNDFDYFCGSTKYFVGDVFVQAGKTTTVTLQPGECAEPVVSEPGATEPQVTQPTEIELFLAFTTGYSEGLACLPRNANYSSNPLLQAEYDRGHQLGFVCIPPI